MLPFYYSVTLNLNLSFYFSIWLWGIALNVVFMDFIDLFFMSRSVDSISIILLFKNHEPSIDPIWRDRI